MKPKRKRKIKVMQENELKTFQMWTFAVGLYLHPMGFHHGIFQYLAYENELLFGLPCGISLN